MANEQPALFSSLVIAVLGMFLNESADSYWTTPLGLNPSDIVTPSLIIGAASVAGASYLPTPFKYGLLWSGTLALLMNIRRYSSVQQEYYPLSLIAVMLVVGMIYAQSTGSSGYFAEHYYNYGY